MDKYEFNLKIDQLKKLIEEEDYVTALKIVQSIDWNRVRNTNLLTKAASVYEKTDNLQEAKDMLILAFERAPVGKHLLFKLTELSCKTGDLEEAEDYYHEFRAIDSTDINNYLLQYMILKARHAPYERQYLPLERYCEIDPDEKWLYELAASYEYANRIEECVRTCDKIALLYGSSQYSHKALRLKQRYTELTDTQKNILYPRSIPEDQVNDAEPVYDALSFKTAETAEETAEEKPDAQQAFVDEMLAEPEMKSSNAGIYDDREYRYTVHDAPATEDRIEETEEEIAARNADLFRKSDELAANRYEDEDAAFAAYVRSFETGAQPSAAEAEMDTVDETPEGDGIQMAFDFGSGTPKVVNDPMEEVPSAETAVEVKAAEVAVPEEVKEEITEAPVLAEAVSKVPEAPAPEAQAPVPGKVYVPQEAPAAPVQETTTPAPAVTLSEPAEVEMRRVEVSVPHVGDEKALDSVLAAATAAAAAAPAFTASSAAAVGVPVSARPIEVQAGSPIPQAKKPAVAQIIMTPEKPVNAAPKKAAVAKRLHMIVEAETLEEGLSIAVDELKNVHEENNIEHASIKTSAEKLNINGITAGIIEKVKGKDFVIENAGSLSAFNIETIYDFILEDKSGTIVVLIDTPEGLDRIEDQRPELFDICDYISDVDEDDEDEPVKPIKPELPIKEDRRPVPYKKPAEEDEPYEDDDDADAPYEDDEDEDEEDERQPVKRSNGKVSAERYYNIKDATPARPDHQMEIDEFAQYCAQYAAEIDCSITGTSMLALYERIELMEEDGIPLTKTNAEQLIEEAADRAEKPPFGKRLTGMFHSKYDKNGLLILKEDDFIY